MLKELLGDRKFYSVMLKIALPIAVQSLVFNLLNAIDVLLIGQLGDTAVAAVGLSNQWSFLMNLFLFGAGSGTAIFTAQYWGREDVPNLRKVFGIGLSVGMFGSALFALAGFFMPASVLSIYTADPAVVAMGAPYLRIVALSYPFAALTTLFGINLRSTRNVKMPVAVSVGALTLKTALSYVLIFGYLGFPAMGIVGGAIATLIARILECGVLLTLTYRWRLPLALRVRDMRGVDRAFVRMFAVTAIPVILNELFWAMGVNVYTAIYAHIGTQSVAAVNIASTIEGVALVPMFGIGNACAIILGNAIGGGDSPLARDYSRKFLALAIALGLGARRADLRRLARHPRRLQHLARGGARRPRRDDRHGLCAVGQGRQPDDRGRHPAQRRRHEVQPLRGHRADVDDRHPARAARRIRPGVAGLFRRNAGLPWRRVYQVCHWHVALPLRPLAAQCRSGSLELRHRPVTVTSEGAIVRCNRENETALPAC